jgi:LysR family transcriptional regulator for metE and metH
MNYLEIKHLRMIRAIAETGNMTRAAEQLFLSQSALSQQLKDIEGKLQVDLFHRTRKKMVLTASGKKLLNTAEQVVDLLDGAELEIAKQVAGERGELKVGTHCIFCFTWLPGLMADFKQQFPNVELEIGTSHNPAIELTEKHYDIIISARQLTDGSYGRQPLFRDQLVCIMEKNNPLAVQPYVHLDDFRDLGLISHANKEDSRFYELFLQPKGIEPKRFMTVGQPQAIVELVTAGLGVSVFPLWAVRGRVEAGTLAALPITGSGVPLIWQALFLQGNNVPVYQQECIRMMQRLDIVLGKIANQ